MHAAGAGALQGPGLVLASVHKSSTCHIRYGTLVLHGRGRMITTCWRVRNCLLRCSKALAASTMPVDCHTYKMCYCSDASRPAQGCDWDEMFAVLQHHCMDGPLILVIGHTCRKQRTHRNWALEGDPTCLTGDPFWWKPEEVALLRGTRLGRAVGLHQAGLLTLQRHLQRLHQLYR